jgi:hypothetical protein
VAVLALVVFLSAVPKPADAGVKCPCGLTAAYCPALVQASRLGLDIKLDTCQATKDGDMIALRNANDSPCDADPTTYVALPWQSEPMCLRVRL